MRKANLKITAMFLAGLMMAGCASSSSVKESGTAAESKTQSAESSSVQESESAAESETEKAPSSTKQTYEERLAEIAAKTEKNVLNALSLQSRCRSLCLIHIDCLSLMMDADPNHIKGFMLIG